MENKAKHFPAFFPKGCPPANAKGERIVLFRLCKTVNPAPEDFLSFYQIDPERYAGNIQAYGLSTYPSAETCKSAKRKSPRLRKECKGIACGQVEADHGKILRTPSNANPAHITWWVYEEIEPHTFFQKYHEGGVEHE